MHRVHRRWLVAMLTPVLALTTIPLTPGASAVTASPTPPAGTAVTTATTTDYIANCDANLRTSPSTTTTSLTVIPTGTQITTSGQVSGGSWSTTCLTAVSGSTWYVVTAVSGKSVSSLYGVSVLYASIGLFRPALYVEGIDVSHWQGTVDWSKVASAGKRFAIMKATQGQTFLDAMYATNHAAARAAGVRAAAYHFADPATTANDAVLQADWFVQNAAVLPGDLTPALDLETTGGLSPSALQTWVGAWLGEVFAKLGVRAMIYTSPNFWKASMGDTTMFADQGYTVLWVAHWFVSAPTVPANNWGGHSWTFWQYDDCGSVPGVGGCVDLDRYNGTDLTPVTFGADFSLSAAPAGRSAKQGRGTSYTIPITRTYFTLPIDLSVTGMPPGATGTFDPTPASDTSSTLTIATSQSGTITPVGTYSLTITGVSGGLNRTTSATLVVTDGIAPTVTAPASRLYYRTTMGSTATPVRTTWSASDPSGIASYVLQRQVNDGSWSAVSLPSATTTSITQSLTFASTYRYAAEATDRAGNTSSWAYGPRFKPLLTQQASSAVSYKGTWTRVSNTYASGGSLKYAKTYGASASYTFTGSSISWVTYRGPTRGSASVYIDGLYKAKISLYSTDYHAKQIAFAFNWASNGTHTIKIVCLGTSGHPRIDVDAFVRLYRI